MWWRWRSRPNPCVIPVQGRGGRDRGIQNNNSRNSRIGLTSGGGGEIGGRSCRRQRGVGRRRGGGPHTRPVARAVSSEGLDHASIREGMGRAERLSSSGNFL